jgi:hypothetical protein
MAICWPQSELHFAGPIGAAVVCLSLALGALPVHAAPADSPFAAMQGAWAGTGTIAFSSGAKERIRCRSNDRLGVNGNELRLELSCASDSYKFELQSQITYSDGAVSGIWSERTRATGGTISGQVAGNRIQVRAEGQTFTAILSVTTRGDRQAISIESPGSEMSGVTITLTRGAR